MPLATLTRPIEIPAIPEALGEQNLIGPKVTRKLFVKIPGQGPKPTQLPGNIPNDISEPFEETTKTKISDIPNKTIEELHSDSLIGSLHALRILGFMAKFRQIYGDVLEDANTEWIPASVSQYVANVIFQSWTYENLFKVTHFRDQITQKLSQERSRPYGMLALYDLGILGADFERDNSTLIERFERIMNTELNNDTHKIYKDGVYVASYPSPSTNTLAGPISRLQEIKAKLDNTRALGATMVDVVNGAYHSPHMRVLVKEMREFIASLGTQDPNRNIGKYHSLTTTEENITSEQIDSDGAELLHLPVFQLQLLNKRFQELLVDPPEEIGVLEFGNSRDYKWGRQQGVQTTCFRDFYTSSNTFHGMNLPPYSAITLGLDSRDYTSDLMLNFAKKFF